MSSSSAVFPVSSALRSRGEEFIDALTHGVGLVLSIVGGCLLMSRAWAADDLWRIAGCGIYASTLVAVYAASMLSHLYLPERLNRLFRSLDQGCIYLLIVGTFSPFALTYLRAPHWFCFYLLALAVAVCGFLSKTVFAHRLENTSVWLYVGLGWGQGLAVPPLTAVIPAEAMVWIVSGGVCYSVGVVFLLLDVRRYHFHSIWHLLVMAGSACHYVAILQFVASST